VSVPVGKHTRDDKNTTVSDDAAQVFCHVDQRRREHVGDDNVERGVHLGQRNCAGHNDVLHAVGDRIGSRRLDGRRGDVDADNGCRASKRGADGEHAAAATDIQHSKRTTFTKSDLVEHRAQRELSRRMIPHSERGAGVDCDREDGGGAGRDGGVAEPRWHDHDIVGHPGRRGELAPAPCHRLVDLDRPPRPTRCERRRRVAD